MLSSDLQFAAFTITDESVRMVAVTVAAAASRETKHKLRIWAYLRMTHFRLCRLVRFEKELQSRSFNTRPIVSSRDPNSIIGVYVDLYVDPFGKL